MGSGTFAVALVLSSLVCGGTSLGRLRQHHPIPIPSEHCGVLAWPISLRALYRFSSAKAGIWRFRRGRHRNFNRVYDRKLEVETRSGVCHWNFVVFGFLNSPPFLSPIS
jgi:hypothetical protein